MTLQHPIFDTLRGQGLKARVLKGSVWTTAGFGGQKVLQLISNLVLAHLLFPKAFGLMALVNVVNTGLAMFSDVGITPAVVQDKRGEDPSFLNTAWTIQIIRGFALWIASCLIAWPASLFYHEPVLLPLLCVVGATAAVNGFQTTAIAIANRKIKLGRLTCVQFGGQAVSITIMITLAWLCESVWALAIGTVAGAVIQTFLGHLFLPSHRHWVHLEKEALRTIFGFGRWIFLATAVTFLAGQGLQAIQGAFVSADTLGLIYIASMFSWALGDMTTRLIGSVGFPAFSKIAREEPQRLRVALNEFRLHLLALALPGFVVLSLASDVIIGTLYDKRYAAAGTYLAIGALSSAVAMLPMFYQSVFLAWGNSRVHFIVMSTLAVLRIGGLVAGFYVAGVEGMLVGIGLGTLIGFFVSANYARREGLFSLRIDLLSIGAIFIGALVSLIWHTR